MPTLLHISDLHRTSGPRFGNDELLAAIASDAERWSREGISSPDLIVVSGDLIQGASVNSPDPDSEIAAQYSEACGFLRHLAAAFVDSDLSRVVIVPGNHDVHRRRARNAMRPLATCPNAIANKAIQATSNLRWNWDDQTAYEIFDADLYQSRFDHFRRFRESFYRGLDPTPLTHNGDDLVHFDYQSLGLVIVGFASWQGNDCFCQVGEIDLAALTTSREIITASSAPIAVAVWHHSLFGGPRDSDYMDQRVIHRLVDFGFTVGLHGHQHYPGAAPFELRLPNLTSMAVVGAGSIAVGDRGLPPGERRQFNLVVIDPDDNSITVHVRAMSSGGVFVGSHRDDFGGKTSIRLRLPRSPSRSGPSSTIKELDDAMTAVATKQYDKALELAAETSTSGSQELRRIRIMALDGLGRHDELIGVLDPPQTADELVRIVSLLLERGRFDDAERRLNSSPLVDSALRRDLNNTIAIRKMSS